MNSGLVDIIEEEFENRSILYATDIPMANANGPHIDAFVMDSYTLSTNTCIATSPEEMITNLLRRRLDTLRH